ncbi:30S ribosomal protein S10 [Halobacteriales archaeon SW_7_68_16]|nr:MAG: 30S ribosomal protein S10 [Halobacteriales archaeon SW_7_68_16]
MTFVTRLRLESGDRAALDAVVSDIKAAAERKGVALNGPHTPPHDTYRVTQHRRLTGEGGEYDPWAYCVYAREVEIVGHDEFARQVTEREFPDSVRIEASVERRQPAGH